jgi:hypothetical protein
VSEGGREGGREGRTEGQNDDNKPFANSRVPKPKRTSSKGGKTRDR